MYQLRVAELRNLFRWYGLMVLSAGDTWEHITHLASCQAEDTPDNRDRLSDMIRKAWKLRIATGASYLSRQAAEEHLISHCLPFPQQIVVPEILDIRDDPRGDDRERSLSSFLRVEREGMA